MPSFCTIPPQAVAGLVPPEMPQVGPTPVQLEQLNQLIQKIKFEMAGTPGLGAPVLGGPMPAGGGGVVPMAPSAPKIVGPALAELRPDLKLAQALPNLTPEEWMAQALEATAPDIPLPIPLPAGPGPLIAQAMKFALAAGKFPLGDPEALFEDIQGTLQCLSGGPGLAAPALDVLNTPDFKNMTDAARKTLALRQEGICPLDLAGVDDQFRIAEGLDPARPKYQEFIKQVIESRPEAMPFAMTSPQVDLANHFAGLAPLEDLPEQLGLPEITAPEFIPELKAQLDGIAGVPLPVPMPPPEAALAMAQKIEAIEVIKQAFGEDALTPQGASRVNEMLDFMARLNLPESDPKAALLANQLGAVPAFEDVQTGAQIAQKAGPALAQSLASPAPQIPLDPVLAAFTALAAVMEKTLGIDPVSPVGADPKELLAAAQAPAETPPETPLAS